MSLRFEDVCAILSVLLGTIALAPYYKGVLNHTIKPHVFTWVTWSLVTSVVAAVQFSEHGGVGAWTTAIGGGQTTGIAILAACGFGTTNITRSDKISFVLALLAIPLWLLTEQPFLAVLMLCFIDGMAFYPTFRKSWFAPHQEKLFTYAVGNIKFLLSVFALETMTLASSLFPLWVIVLDTAFIAMVVWLRRVRVVVQDLK